MAVSEAVKAAYNPAPPAAAMTDVLGEAVRPLSVTHDGVVWKFGFPTQAAKARYEQLVFEREKETVLRQKSFLSKEDFQERCDKLSQQIEQRQFATGQPLWMKYSISLEGYILWIQSLLAEHHPGVTFEQVVGVLEGKADEVRLVLGAIVPSFFEWTLGLGEEAAGRLGERAAEGARAKIALARGRLPAVLAQWELS